MALSRCCVGSFWRPRSSVCVLVLTLIASGAARADFFDDARRTFQTDIPHFFQDDIPCAFGGQPTSHTKTSCKAPDHPAKPAAAPADARTGGHSGVRPSQANPRPAAGAADR